MSRDVSEKVFYKRVARATHLSSCDSPPNDVDPARNELAVNTVGSTSMYVASVVSSLVVK